MPYTLTSAATLGYDLVRLPAGRQAAGVVVSALISGPEQWALFAAHHPLRTSDPLADPLRAADDAARARDLAAGVPRLGSVVQGMASGPAGIAGIAERLRTSLVGSAAAMERLVRSEALDAATTAEGGDAAAADRELAADVLADAAVAAYAARELPRALRRRLSEPYERAVAGSVPGTFDLAPDPRTPWGTALTELLAAMRDLDAHGRARWRAAVDDGRAAVGGSSPWATAMHDACWAAHVAGRLPAAAAAQMLAVQAFSDAGFDLDDGATGVWNAVSGCVQGLLVADLLPSMASSSDPLGPLDTLLAPWARVTGQPLLR